jgi:hypothetical protein
MGAHRILLSIDELGRLLKGASMLMIMHVFVHNHAVKICPSGCS